MHKKSKVRYDRVISVIVITILAVYAITQIFGNSSDEKTAVPDEPEKFVPTVYLSPSNQTDSIYAYGDVTEAEIMRTISEKAAQRLEANGIEVFIAKAEWSLQESVDYINENQFTAHVAIHSNAGTDGKSGEGTECFYNSGVSGSEKLAGYIYDRVARLTPTDDRGMIDGSQGSSYLYEVAASKTPNCLIEIEFHNSSDKAKWITEHTDELGNAVADGIIQYMDYAEKNFKGSNETENGK